MRKFFPNSIAWTLTALILISAGIVVAIKTKQNKLSPEALPPKNVYLAFTDEVYDTIQKNYWDTISDDQLSEIYRLAAAKISTTAPATLISKNQAGLNTLVSGEIKNMSPDQKKAFVSMLANIVLSNLKPFGRSALYTQQNIQALNNEVNNVDLSTNLYSDLGLNKTATPKQIDQAYEEKSQALVKQNTKEAKQQLALVNRAFEALKIPERKQQYDQTGSEPAVTYRELDKNTYFIKISRFSPTLLNELRQAASSTPKTANTLIIDLRGNIGGAIDQLPSVLGEFLGENQNTFNFFQQGSAIPFPSQGPMLTQISQFKKIIILTDNQVQSSTEMMLAALKKYKLGIVVGTPTKGWGTVEYPFPIQNQIDSSQTYSVFLVRYLTLADDNRPVEGNGILPNIDIANKAWPDQLTAATGDAALTRAVQNLVSQE